MRFMIAFPLSAAVVSYIHWSIFFAPLLWPSSIFRYDGGRTKTVRRCHDQNPASSKLFPENAEVYEEKKIQLGILEC